MKNITLRFFWLFLSICLNANAQTTGLDSLETLLKKPIGDSLRIELMNQIGFQYIFQNTKKAAFYFEEAVQLSQKIKFIKGEANAYNMKGLLYRVDGLYEQALKLHFHSLELCEKIGHKDGQAYNFSNIGMVYAEQNDYKKAIIYYRRALSIKKQLRDSISLSFTLNDIAVAYLQLNHYDSALFYNLQSLKIGQILNNKGGIAYNLLNIGTILYLKKEYAQAEKYLLQSEQLCQENVNTYVEVQAINSLANLYFKTKNTEKALYYASKGLEIAKKHQMKKDIKESALSLSKIYAQQNKYAQAYHYQNMFIAYKDSLNNLDLDKKTALMAAQYEHERKENQLKAKHAQTTLKQN